MNVFRDKREKEIKKNQSNRSNGKRTIKKKNAIDNKGRGEKKKKKKNCNQQVIIHESLKNKIK